MSRLLFENLEDVGLRIAGAKRILLFLDYDGTLAPIAPRPETAHLPPSTRGILLSLSQTENILAAIISGRALADVQARVGIPGFIYAGNHGLEICGRGLSFVEPKAASQRDELARLCDKLASRLLHIAGAEVENKGLTAAVHFRRAAPGAEEEIFAIIQEATSNLSQSFVLRRGKKIYEIRPRVDWNKGSAVRWIADQFAENALLPVYIGDDVTDEDAFKALPEGVTVKVGDPAGTSASYHLVGQPEVERFLVWLRETHP